MKKIICKNVGTKKCKERRRRPKKCQACIDGPNPNGLIVPQKSKLEKKSVCLKGRTH